MMADEIFCRQMINERHLAMVASGNISAVAAHDERSRAAPVQKQNDLLITLQFRHYLCLECFTEDRKIFRRDFFSHVSDADLGQMMIFFSPSQIFCHIHNRSLSLSLLCKSAMRSMPKRRAKRSIA